MILAVVLPLQTYTIDAILELVAWVQRRNHQAYLSHRARRQEEGDHRDGSMLHEAWNFCSTK
jgi:hypothetical protein